MRIIRILEWPQGLAPLGFAIMGLLGLVGMTLKATAEERQNKPVRINLDPAHPGEGDPKPAIRTAEAKVHTKSVSVEKGATVQIALVFATTGYSWQDVTQEYGPLTALGYKGVVEIDEAKAPANERRRGE